MQTLSARAATITDAEIGACDCIAAAMVGARYVRAAVTDEKAIESFNLLMGEALERLARR